MRGLCEGTSDLPSIPLAVLYQLQLAHKPTIAADLRPERLFGWGSTFHPNSIKRGFCGRYAGWTQIKEQRLPVHCSHGAGTVSGLMVPASPFSRSPTVPSLTLCVSFAQHQFLLPFFSPRAYPQSLKQYLVSLLTIKIYPSSSRAGPGIGVTCILQECWKPADYLLKGPWKVPREPTPPQGPGSCWGSSDVYIGIIH